MWKYEEVKITFKWFQRSLIEAYNIAERRIKLNNKTTFHCKILIVFADNVRLINIWKWYSTIIRIFECFIYVITLFQQFIFTNTNPLWIKILKIKTFTVFNLVFDNNKILSCFFPLFLNHWLIIFNFCSY